MYNKTINSTLQVFECDHTSVWGKNQTEIGTFTGSVIFNPELSEPSMFIGVFRFHEQSHVDGVKPEELKVMTSGCDNSYVYGFETPDCKPADDGWRSRYCGQCGHFEPAIGDGWCQCFNEPANMHQNLGRGCIGFHDRKNK